MLGDRSTATGHCRSSATPRGSPSWSTCSRSLVLVGVGHGVLDPQGAAARPVPRLPPRGGRSHPARDHRDRRDAAAVERVARSRSAWWRHPGPVSDALVGPRSAAARPPRSPNASWCGPTCWSCSASSSTCRPRSTCTSSRRRRTCGSPRPGPAASSSLSRSTSRRPRTRSGSAPPRLPTCRGPQTARPVLVHGVRALPGRLPRVGDRQAAQPEAPDHAAARPRRRRGARDPRRPPTAPASWSSSRWCPTP